MSVTLSDFKIINTWKLDAEGEKYDPNGELPGEPKFLIDETTNRRYLNESYEVVQIKCILLSLGTLFIHPLGSIVNVAYRIWKLASLSHFRVKKDGDTNFDFNARFVDAAKDFCRIIFTPVSILGLELVAIYGIFRPNDGRKLYASIERAMYGDYLLAPCFQPEPKYHALGGEMNKKDSF